MTNKNPETAIDKAAFEIAKVLAEKSLTLYEARFALIRARRVIEDWSVITPPPAGQNEPPQDS